MKEEKFELLVPFSASYLLGARAAVTFASKDYFTEPDKPISVNEKYRGAVPWGSDNDLPRYITDTLGKNPVGSGSMELRIDIAYGAGVKFGVMDENGEFREATQQEKQGIYAAVEQFFQDNDMNTFMSELITDINFFYNGFVEIILDMNDPGSRRVVSMEAKEAYFSRWETANLDTGIVENHFYSALWPKKPKETEVTITPVIWAKNAAKELEIRIGRRPNDAGKTKDEKKFRYILPVRLPSPGRTYYTKPYWYSVIESGWMEFANKIPEFKKQFMLNSLYIAYHIEINEQYFPKIFAKEGITTKKGQEERVKKELDNLNEFLKGAEKAGKSMITYFKSTPDGKVEIPDIKIHVIDKKIGGEYIDDSHEASAMIAYAMRVHPSLIGTIPGKTTSNLSGSDKRELLRIAQSLQKRVRDQILKPLYLVKQINKWSPEIVFSIPDIFLTTLDTNGEIDKSAQV